MQKLSDKRASHPNKKKDRFLKQLRTKRRDGVNFNRSSSLLAIGEFIKSRLINYARSTSPSATFRTDFPCQFANSLNKNKTNIYPDGGDDDDHDGPESRLWQTRDAFNRARSFQKVSSLPRLILLPASQRIKRDTRTIALHDHQVTFTLSSHPLAVYPVQPGADRPRKNRWSAPRRESYRRVAETSECEGNSLMFSPLVLSSFCPRHCSHRKFI